MGVVSDWHIPIGLDAITLQEALQTAPGMEDLVEMPLMLQLQCDPELSFLGQLLTISGLDKHQHDCIHILLGRGVLPMDQAFVLGFTLASNKKGSIPEHKLHAEVARHFFNKTPLLSETDSAIFREGIKLGYLSFCAPVDSFDFYPWLDQPLRLLREAVGLDTELLQAYFALEKHRYPHSLASQRLLTSQARAAGL